MGWRLIGRYGLLIVVSVIVLFRIYTTVVASLKPGNRVLVHPLVPESLTLQVFREAWTEGHLNRYMVNSIVVAVIVTVAQVVTSVLAAYAFAILEWPGRSVFCLLPRHAGLPLETTSWSTARRSTTSAGSTATRA